MSRQSAILDSMFISTKKKWTWEDHYRLKRSL